MPPRPTNGVNVNGIRPKPKKTGIPLTAIGKPSGKKFDTANDAVTELERRYGPRSALWTYHDARGEPVGLAVRWDLADGKKDVRPVSRVGNEWYIGGMPEPRPLYCLPDLADATRVYVCEGEKAAEAARSIGLTATTSAHGCESPGKADWRPLAGKEIILLPDHDEPGWKYATAVADLLSNVTPAPVIKLLELPDLPYHGDMADFVAQSGRDADETRLTVEALADEAEPMQVARSGAAVERFVPFPVDALPEPLRGFVIAGAKAIGCDASYLALPMLTAAGAAIGHTRRLRLKRTWTCSTTLWAAVIGESGDKKSPPMELALLPFENREFDAGDRHEVAMEQYERERALWEKDYKAWERNTKTTDDPPQEPQAPVAKRFLIDDATIESVTPIMRDNPRGVLCYKDELKQWFGSFDRYVSRKGGDDAYWLKVFNNKLVINDRKTSGTIRARRPFICIIGGIQPGTLRRVLGVEHLESGMAARLLLAWPPSRPRKWSDAELPKRIEDAMSAVIDRLFGLEAERDENGRPRPVLIWPTDAARRMFIRYYDDHADEMAELSGDLKAAWSKLEEYAARLALMIHYVRWAANDPTLEAHDKVDEASMKAGIQLTEWFKNEARRVYAMLSESDEDRDRRKLIEWIERKGGPITSRDVQMGCRWLRKPGAAEAALEDLAKAGCGNWESTPRGRRGQPTRFFRLSTPATVNGISALPDESSNTVDVDTVVSPETQADGDWGEI